MPMKRSCQVLFRRRSAPRSVQGPTAARQVECESSFLIGLIFTPSSLVLHRIRDHELSQLALEVPTRDHLAESLVIVGVLQ